MSKAHEPEGPDGRPPHPPPVTLLVGSGNRHKVEEIAEVLSTIEMDGRPVRVVGADVLGPGDPVPETGDTFEENAVEKARAWAERALALPVETRPEWVLADDSGLCVDELGGAPGVISARYGGPGAKDADNNRKLLAALAGVPRERRGAEFVCVIACVRVGSRPGTVREAAGEAPVIVRGACRGEILEAPRGAGGFGYDPLFFFAGVGKTFAELTRDEKSRHSHRGRALVELRKRLPAVNDRRSAPEDDSAR